MAAIPLPPPRHRLHAQRPEAGRSRGVSRLGRGPKCPRDELAASQQHPAWPLSPFAVPFKGLLPQSGILCLPPAAPVLPQCNQYGGLYLQHHPLLTLGAESNWQEKIHLMCFLSQALGPAVDTGCGAEGAVLGQGCRAPPPLPSSSLPGKGPAWLPQPFLQAGLVCSPQAMDGLAAAYSKCERAVLGRAFAVPQAANRPCPTGTAACRRRLLFPARPWLSQH